MARITIDDALARIPNRFELTLAATNRARQISAGSQPLLDPDRDKPTVIALREIAHDPHLLNDLGLSRDEAPHEAARPFWR